MIEPMQLLLVEDSRSLAYLAVRRLQQQLDCQVHLCHSLADTLALLQSDHPPFFVAVVDLTLPDAQAGEIIDLSIGHGLRTIVLTGTFGEEWRETILAKNVVDYVIKRDLRDFDYLAQLLLRLQKNAAIKVMVVDDSPSYRAYMRRLLEIQNLQVFEAQHGKAALELFAEQPEISLVITDYQMPEMDGLELVTQLRERSTPDRLAVIGISSENDASLSARFLKNGGSDFLRKPFGAEEFNWRVRLNLERLEQIEALKQSLETKNRFLGIAAHDLRSPLGNIQGFSRLMLRGGRWGDPTPEQQELLQVIVNESRQMLRMIEDLLDVSLIESGNLNLNLQTADLKTLIEERLQTSRLLAEPKQIELQAELADVPPVPCDPQRFVQILDNLISNAIKYSEPGTRVQVRLLPEPEQLLLQVVDQGQGLSEADQARLFKDFQRLSSRPTGGERSTGLGLAIVKRMLDAHRWCIRVESTLGQGSCFEIQIPLPSEAA
jgi:signal transduction histidine kinase